MTKQLEVKVPDIGDFKDVPVIEVLVAEGDHVDKETPLITLESEKATMEVPSPAAGTVRAIKLKEGDTVSEGSLVLLLDAEQDAVGTASGTGDAPQRARSAHGQKKSPEPAEAAKSSQPAPQPPPPTAGGKVDAKVPDIGDFKDVPVIEVLVAEGDHVDKETPLITLESEKATMEVPSPAAGTVRAIKLKEGDTVSEGTLICTIEGPAAQADAAVPAHVAPDTETEPLPPPTPPERAQQAATKVDRADVPAAPTASAKAPVARADQGEGSAAASPYASPSVRKFARELGIDLRVVRGSGRSGRILQSDVQSHVKQLVQKPGSPAATGFSIPQEPPVDFSQFGEIETKPMIRIRKLSAAHLHSAWLNVPHVTQTDEADITEMEAFRHAQNSRRGLKLTLLPFVLKAVAKGIDAYPEFAASLDPKGENLVMKHYRHLGFAADTANGLVVPVVRDVDRKGIEQLARETGELAGKARDGKLSSEEMKGGVFSVSSLGGIGGGYFTPIVNTPEVGILGVSKAVMKPVWDGQQFQPRLMLPISLSYDHRVIDGAYAARFIVYLASLLSDLRRLLL